MKYFVYTHKRNDTDTIFYVGVGKYYFKKQTNYKLRKYDRAFSFGETNRNKYWIEIFNQCKKDITVKILEEFDNIEDAYSLEESLIKKYGKLHNNTGILANMQDGGFVSNWGKSVVCYNYDGIFYKKYDTAKDAAIDLGIKSVDSVYHSINNKAHTNKYFFAYCNGNYPQEISFNIMDGFLKSDPHSCYQYSRSGKFIKKWRCVEDAAKELNIDRGSIRKCIYGKQKQAKNFVWSYNRLKFSKDIFEIGQYDDKGNLLNQYINSGIAEKESGVFNASILMCCKGKMKSAGGFIWKYIKV